MGRQRNACLTPGSRVGVGQLPEVSRRATPARRIGGSYERGGKCAVAIPHASRASASTSCATARALRPFDEYALDERFVRGDGAPLLVEGPEGLVVCIVQSFLQRLCGCCTADSGTLARRRRQRGTPFTRLSRAPTLSTVRPRIRRDSARRTGLFGPFMTAIRRGFAIPASQMT
jgi:hypothetical protein